METVIVDYGSGNLHSALKSVERAARQRSYDLPVVVSADPERVLRADRVILPGVGAFADCRAGLEAVPGMIAAMTETVKGRGRPFLGICVGMQLLATRGLEFADAARPPAAGLDWVPGDVRRIEPGDSRLKIPHMGWNTIDLAWPHPVFDGIATGDGGLHAYFVHSFHLAPARADTLLATAPYGRSITAAVAVDSIVGVQFHPEKSQTLGLTLLGNFLTWRP